MNKRFASFLLAGKVAAMPLFAQESLGAIQNIHSKTMPHKPMHASFVTDSLKTKPLGADEYENTLNIPDNFDKRCVQQIMNLVINGLYDRDEVLIVISPEKEIANFLETEPLLLSKLHTFEVWNKFSVLDTSSVPKNNPVGSKQKNHSLSKKSIRAISLPVNLSSISQYAKDGSKLYLHMLIAPNSKWDKSVFRYSDAIEIKSHNKTTLLSYYGDSTEDCTSYSCF
jgi:hypothetical protein